MAAKKIADLPWNAPRGATGDGVVTPPRKVAVVRQTTKNVDELMKFAQQLQSMVMPEGGEFRLCNTICEPTRERQNALQAAGRAGPRRLILAIGGRKSSNTARLAEVGNALGVPSHHIERPEEIEAGWLAEVECGRRHGRRLNPRRRHRGGRLNSSASRGYAPPDGGIRPADPDYVPAY